MDKKELSYDQCKDLSKLCESRSKFKSTYRQAYKTSLKNNWLNDFYEKQPTNTPKGVAKECGYWNNKENCINESKKYKTWSEFAIGSIGAYTSARRNNWLKEFNWLTRTNKKPSGYWTEETCREESKKYKSRTEFSKYADTAYKLSKKNEWIDSYTWIKDYKSLNKDKVDCIYVYEFPNNVIYVGRTIDRINRDKHHRLLKNGTVRKYSDKNSLSIPEMKIIEDNLTIQEGINREEYWIEYYKSQGWTLLNVAKAGSVGSIGRGKWSKNELKILASNYLTKTEFKKSYRKEYDYSRRKGWISEFFNKKDYYKRSVDKLDMEGNLLQTYSSMKEACNELKIKACSSITKVCRGERDSYKGYKWRYHTDSPSSDLNTDN